MKYHSKGWDNRFILLCVCVCIHLYLYVYIYIFNAAQCIKIISVKGSFSACVVFSSKIQFSKFMQVNR